MIDHSVPTPTPLPPPPRSYKGASLIAQLVKNPPAMQETWAQFLGPEDPLEKEVATHSCILAWRTPWTKETGGLQSMGSQELDMTEWLNWTCSSVSKESACNAETQVWSLGQEVPLKKEMETHSSILAWEIPWTEESGRLQSMGSQESDTT